MIRRSKEETMAGMLDGKTALITGAARGIGRAAACCSPGRAPASPSPT